jgi:hypothetical protein
MESLVIVLLTLIDFYGLMLAITVLSLAAACQVKSLTAQKREAKPVETPAKLGSTNEKGEKK